MVFYCHGMDTLRIISLKNLGAKSIEYTGCCALARCHSLGKPDYGVAVKLLDIPVCMMRSKYSVKEDNN